MSAKLCKHLPLLKMLHKATPKQRRLILQSSSDKLILTLCEVALNILYGMIPINRQQYQKLKRRKSEITVNFSPIRKDNSQEMCFQPEGWFSSTPPKRCSTIYFQLNSV